MNILSALGWGAVCICAALVTYGLVALVGDLFDVDEDHDA